MRLGAEQANANFRDSLERRAAHNDAGRKESFRDDLAVVVRIGMWAGLLFGSMIAGGFIGVWAWHQVAAVGWLSTEQVGKLENMIFYSITYIGSNGFFLWLGRYLAKQA